VPSSAEPAQTYEKLDATRRARAIALLALLAGVLYLGWRWGWTLRWETAWLGLPLLVAETWAFLSAGLFAFSVWSLTTRRGVEAMPGQRVAVLIPTYNEPADILRPTILGALGIRYRPRPEVWVLDDGDREWVAAMCRELGVRYLTRPAPREHAKAGNLNHALRHVDADFLVIVDADHVTMPNFVERTLGYMSDPKVAFVQSPQTFFNRSFQHPRNAVDDPLLNEQSLFYDVICRGKDRDNACFWCGSSALVRREALLSVGGVATDTVVEDTHTAMKLHQAGWKSVYHPEVLAVGLAPEEVSAFLTQRGRWSSGCYQMLRRANPLFARGLGFRQRLHYFSSVSHYIEGPQRLIGLLVPPFVLLTGTIPLAAPALLYLTLFLPQLVLVPLATGVLARGRFDYGESERYTLVRVIAYTKAAAAFFRAGRVSFKVTPKGAATENVWLATLKWQVVLGVFAVCAVGYQASAQVAGLPGRLSVFAFAVTVFWSLINAGLLGFTVWHARAVRHRRSAHRFPVVIPASFRADGDDVTITPVTIRDLNPLGLSMRARTDAPIGKRVRVALTMDGSHFEVVGDVVRCERVQDGAADLGVRFVDLAQDAQDAIIRWCFSHPFGPDVPLHAEGDAVQRLPELEPHAGLATAG
jgi:cellulose synthase (UDP-forming)